jgi:hypothetical protein
MTRKRRGKEKRGGEEGVVTPYPTLLCFALLIFSLYLAKKSKNGLS